MFPATWKFLVNLRFGSAENAEIQFKPGAQPNPVIAVVGQGVAGLRVGEDTTSPSRFSASHGSSCAN